MTRARVSLLLVALLFAAPAAAQRPGKADVTGTVADQSGVLPPANVVVRNLHLKADLMNAFNSVNFSAPNNVVGRSPFLVIFTASYCTDDHIG